MKRITQALLVVALGLIVASSAGAYTGTYTPGAGINGTPHDMSLAVNGMNYTAESGRHAGPDLHLLPRAAQHLQAQPGQRRSGRGRRRRPAGAGRVRLPAAVEPRR